MVVEAIASREPPRVHLINLSTREDLEVLMNPTRLALTLRPNYDRLEVQGFPRKILQYRSTNNLTIPQLEFTVNRLILSERTGELLPETLDFQRFLMALCYPPAGAGNIAANSPPEVVFLWPAARVTLECKVTNLSFEFTRWSILGDVMVYTARVDFEESVSGRLTSEEVRFLGSER